MIHTDDPGLTLYMRVRKDGSTAIAVALTEAPAGFYSPNEASLVSGGLTAAGQYAGKVFEGTPSTSANDDQRGSFTLKWDGAHDVASDAAVLAAIDDVAASPDTRDLDEVNHVWVLARTGEGALASTDETAYYVRRGSEDLRAGFDCNIPSILPNGTVLAEMAEPTVSGTGVTVEKLGIGPNGVRQPMLAKVSIDVAADAEPGEYTVQTTVRNRLGAGPIPIQGTIIVLE